ncbi:MULTISPECIES: CPBP family intramembrane glutamic endopeptidase [Staphylococcus]|jgi:membrane protease YdiL (CAAX protease family)|uniref:CPBP family intramembrane metalloprotease n=2 Tax=Staphylococcus nepalensis TaxID=214473 RepID=A0A291JIB5_9STAP|nr:MULTISPECIES: CPBP family intramembrane glutamic endopeptidase [Staphylococcus]VDG66220.1 CAAX amino terminal protease [Lacrimispora indolis]ATH59300.1 CAAX protease [Staphylococcus nepalensis]ATH64393.1 CAAX protease [Staphylococcus nepalensis]AWI43753.1 CAAX protease [Staphylococcus nepalensis]MBO1205607.1 CPBP family intramembrane metalloprotease [Staphylococcus nepalensis]
MTDKPSESHITQFTHTNIWQKQKVVKRDFWLIPIYILANNIIPLMLLIFLLALYSAFNLDDTSLFSNHNVLIIGGVIAEISIIFSFYLMHINDNLKTMTTKRFKQVRKYVLVIFITYISTIGLNSFYDWLMTLLPETLQYSETQNQMILEDMFENNWMLPFLFVDIVVLTPIIEELLFRHLIIHELGKKITYGVASVLSVILFAGIHVLGATSPFEIGSYIFIALGLVFVYLKSGKNLAVSISLHAFNNLISFIAIVFLK